MKRREERLLNTESMSICANSQYVYSFSFTLTELLDSEREYIDRLSFCINNYKTSIDQSSSTPKTLKISATDLFGNIVDICNFHKK